MDYKLLVVALLVVAVAISAFLEWVKLTAKKQKKEIPTFVLIIVPCNAVNRAVVGGMVGARSAGQGSDNRALCSYRVRHPVLPQHGGAQARPGKPVARFFMRSKGMSADEIKEALGE